MKLVEIILIVFTIIGLIFKLMHLPLAGLILTISLMSLAMFYGISVIYKVATSVGNNTLSQTAKNSIPLSVVSSMFLGILIIGILFKLMFWPMSGIMLLFGIMGTTVIFIVTLILFFTKKDLKPFCKELLIRVGSWLFVGILLYSTSTETLIKIQYRDDPELARLIINANKTFDEKDFAEIR